MRHLALRLAATRWRVRAGRQHRHHRHAHGGLQYFGLGGTPTYGQTFTPDATQTSLTGFSLFLDRRLGANTGPLALKGYLATWDGSKAGTILYTSDVRTKPNDNDLAEVAFATTQALVASQQYVAFLSILEINAAQTDLIEQHSHRDERSFAERCDGRGPLFCGVCIVGIVDEEARQDVLIQGSHGLPRRERVSSEAGSKSSRRTGPPRAGALTIPAMPLTSAVATERTTRSFSPSDSSSTSILAPGPIPSRRRNEAGNTIWPFEETSSSFR
jgi:hypothetical protein